MKRLLPVLAVLACVIISRAANPESHPVALFDGTTLAGWEGDAKLWSVEDGMITGGSLTETVTHNDFLATVKSYANFDLRLKLRLTGTGFVNSGIQMRSVRVPGSPEMSGYQVDYGKGWYGKLYDESRRNKVVAESKDMAAATAAIKEGEWNEYRVRAEGAHIQSWINGVPALDYLEADGAIVHDGQLGIQIHGGGKARVQVKDVTIEELPEPSPLKVKVEGAEWAPPGFAEAAAEMLKAWYPRVRHILGVDYETASEITLRFRDFDGVAQTTGTTIEASTKFFSKHPDDVGAILHEMVHVIQAYPPGSPGWLVEGVADYVRYYYFEPVKGAAFRARPGQSYKSGYHPAAALLASAQVGKPAAIVAELNRRGHAGKLTEEVFKEVVGQTPDEVWNRVPGNKATAAGKPAPQRDISYNAVASAAKTPDVELATFKVPEGFEVQLVAAESEGIGKFVPLAFDQHGALWTTTAFEYPVDGNENPAAADALYASQAKDKVLIFDRDPKSPTGLSSKPRVFAEGLAIPLGVLPYKNGCYVQHGHDIAFLEDTDADGKADKRTVILTGFGVQDSHLFPHQFMRAPGGWIWMAQGAFNSGKVSQPGHEKDAVQFDQTRMAKFRPDGSGFDITSNGPCNIWGLVLNGEGEAFIQEANDFGYPVMPFHEYANYPGCSDRQWKSYAPEFPGTAPDFKMGGTGLSGLALLDEGWVKLLGAVGNAAAAGAQKQTLSSRAERSGTEGPLTVSPRGGEPMPAPAKSSAPPPPADALAHGQTTASPGYRPLGGPSTPLRSAQDDRVGGVNAGSQTVLVANPITNRIQGIKMHRDGPRWRLDPPTDFLVSDDPWFRPVAITIGPDGCLYIVDWYNKIISHNEVPRNHPDRDKTRGRIWRVRAKATKPFEVPDFTKLSGDELIAKLGGESLAQSHLAWQAIADRGMKELAPRLLEIALPHGDRTQPDSRRIAALWAYREIAPVDLGLLDPFLGDTLNRNVQREGINAAPIRPEKFRSGAQDDRDMIGRVAMFSEQGDPEVRAAVIRALAKGEADAVPWLLRNMAEPLAEPVAPSTHKPQRQIKVREAYDREFERYLVRMFLERHPDATAKVFDSPNAARDFSDDALVLAALALEPKASAARVAKLLPQLQRAPGQEEVLRLAQFPDEPGVGEALKAILANPVTSPAALEALLTVRTRLDAGKVTPLLAEAAQKLLAGDRAQVELGLRLASAFKVTSVESALVALLQRGPDLQSGSVKANASGEVAKADYKSVPLSALRALAEIGSSQSELFAKLAKTSTDPLIRDEALAALAASKAPDAPAKVLALYPQLPPAGRRTALDRLSATKSGAAAIVAALTAGTIAKTDLDAATLDRLQAVLGPDDPTLAKLVDDLGALFRPVLALDGSDSAWTQTSVTLDGPCTIEAWVRLDPQGRKIGNNDSIAGAPGQLDFNFFGERARIYAFPPLNDVAVAKKPVTPGLWTHVAATRDAAGIWKIYIDGELDSTGNKPAPGKIENVRIGWNGAKGGTQGMLGEVRLWNRERSAEELRAACDRSLPADTPALVFTSSAGDWGKLQAGARIVKTSDFPPVLTDDEAITLDAKYAKNRALAAQPGDPARGKIMAALCQACHLMGPTGGNIGPNLSGVGAMGTEAILRNILQPNAAMENGYRIYRVELRSGDLVDALFVSEDEGAVIVRLPGTDDRRIAKSDIHSTRYLRRSLMPEGLLDALTPQQVGDLFAYLLSLK